MRMITGTRTSDSDLTIGDVAEDLSHVRSRIDLDRCIDLIERLVHADDIAVSLVVPGERCVETLSTHVGEMIGQRYSFDDYPTTERVVGVPRTPNRDATRTTLRRGLRRCRGVASQLELSSDDSGVAE